jgi:hypothetical protein
MQGGTLNAEDASDHGGRFSLLQEFHCMASSPF